MAVKFQNRAKKNARGLKQYEAPVAWVELLRKAVEEPGIISKAYSMFHTYSFGNQLMALSQLSDRGIEIGPIASYGRWQELGRQVRKGETALVMQVPRTWNRVVEGADGEEKKESRLYFNFRPTSFAYAQTDPIEGQEDGVSKLSVEAPDWSMARAMATLDIKEKPFTDLNGNKQGYAEPKARTVHINPVAANPDKTRLHEMAHILMHQDGYDGSEHRGVFEFEAECTAFILSTILGFASGAESRGYCQHWLSKAGQEDITDKTANRVLGSVQKILAAGRPAKEVASDQDQATAA